MFYYNPAELHFDAMLISRLVHAPWSYNSSTKIHRGLKLRISDDFRCMVRNKVCYNHKNTNLGEINFIHNNKIYGFKTVKLPFSAVA